MQKADAKVGNALYLQAVIKDESRFVAPKQRWKCLMKE
jgi:hypothetical protein